MSFLTNNANKSFKCTTMSAVLMPKYWFQVLLSSAYFSISPIAIILNFIRIVSHYPENKYEIHQYIFIQNLTFFPEKYSE